MSFFDDASLVMIPSGYKDQKVYSVKPIDGSGDLTFSRASNASRINSSGLVEKVRTNEILYSQDFSGWSATSCTVTTNTTANPLNGAVDADTITFTGATAEKYVIQSFSFNGVYTVSAYLKAGTNQFVQFLLGSDAAVYVNFDLVNGIRSGAFGSVADMVSLGNGWYRCSMSFTSTTGTHVFIQAVDSLAAYRFSPTTSTGTLIAFGYQLETGDIATDYIATTSSAVSVGPVSGLPRLDYSGGASCPSLLLEPQRTNLVIYSEQIDNAAWTKDGTTATANQTASPSGYADADLVTNNGVSGDHTIYQTIGLSATTYTVSAYVKKNTESYVHLTLNLGSNANEWATATFNLDTATSANYSSVLSTPSSTITAFGTDGWYRVTMTCTLANTANHILLIGFAKAGAPDTARGRYVTANTNSFYIWGCQTEAGAYATSYINSLSTAVTRVTESYQKGGFGNTSTAGTFFYEFKAVNINSDNGKYLIGLGVGTTDTLGGDYANAANSLSIIANGPSLQGRNNGYADTIFTYSPATGSNQKIAIRYDGTNIVAFINGVKQTVYTDNAVGVKNFIRANNGEQTSHASKQILFFPSALTDAECITLTT